ncbi:MAG: hypothetical protein Q7R57_02585 [Dehalococcoidales bacterium]|nr:hypothetical protein [Dehalococcoidales bacterium]
MTTYPIRKLDEASLARLQEMERKLGCCIIAIGLLKGKGWLGY